jgi:tetratricopeptide (TPR) repeat protein/AraC-like DNA-binding protein
MDKLRRLRDRAAEPVLRRIRCDRETSHSRLHAPLDTIARRLFDTDFDVAALWRETGIRNHNATTWFSELATTPAAYIAANRLDTAAAMLRLDREVKVFRILREVGLTPDSFSAPFKNRFGMTPSQYRKVAVAADDGRLTQVDTALAAGSPWAALEELGRMDATQPAVAARLGLAWHGSGADLWLHGRIDDAYDHLSRAHEHYRAAGELPPWISRHRVLTAVSCKTDEALLDGFCQPCRDLYLGDLGASLRDHLRDSLSLLPLDLSWFKACCDECYRFVWKAVALARSGFLPDASKAWWLCSHADLADPDAPPSLGRFMAALRQIAERQFQNQNDRLLLAERAHADAKILGKPLLVAEARLWCGNIERALAQFPKARKNLKLQGDLTSPWLLALCHRFSGILAHHTTHYQEALDCYRTAVALYKNLDRHVAAEMTFNMGEVHREMGRYETAIEHYQDARTFFDSRRDPLPAHAAVPVSLAVIAAVRGEPGRARAEIARCHYDRDRHPAVAASEAFTRGCIAQADRQSREAVGLWAEAQRRFEELGQFEDAALAAAQSVEGYYDLGEKAEAITRSQISARFFEKAGCSLDTLQAVGRLQALLQSETDSKVVTGSVRRLAGRHGGWLPVPRTMSGGAG